MWTWTNGKLAHSLVTDINIDHPPFRFVATPFAVGLIVGSLVEDLRWILRPSRSIRGLFRVRQTEITEELAEIIRTVLDTELLFEELLDLL
jgi:hypothetical protein